MDFKALFISLFLLMNSSLVIAQHLTKYSSADCASCHQKEIVEWQRSHHAKSMMPVALDTVRGAFGTEESPIRANHKGLSAAFFAKELEKNSKVAKMYFLSLTRDGKTNTFHAKYTFGIEPLQQYLVEPEPLESTQNDSDVGGNDVHHNRMQVFPFAWDTRPKSEGGQRWFTQYIDEDILPADRLHWQQPLQNWNGMCADCHSDNLKRGYNSKTNTFKTSFNGNNVDCLACHDDKSIPHQSGASKIANSGVWFREQTMPTAIWKGEPRNNDFMDTCFACHSLRTPLTDGFDSTTKFHNQFMPSLLTPPLYHKDGQIKEEVYVYGSFLQSKMYHAGVNCVDCHNPHTLKLKSDNNALCAQCHAPEVFDVKEHHGHPLNSLGAKCINCHMPEKAFMVVDYRADHSFKVPRPDWTKKYGVPNACQGCHTDKTVDWAQASLNELHGDLKARPNEELYMHLLSEQQATSQQEYWRFIFDESVPVIKRATALSVLGTRHQVDLNQLKRILRSEHVLLKQGALAATTNMPPQQLAQLLAPLLNDINKSVRVDAALRLVGAQLPHNYLSLFKQAFKELEEMQDTNNWRGEGRMNTGITALKMRNVSKAETQYKMAIFIDPYFAQGYVNLSDVYRTTNQVQKEYKVYVDGIEKLPNNALIRYASSLFHVRQKDYNSALVQIKEAVELAPENTQYIYAYALILDRLGFLKKALTILEPFSINTETPLNQLYYQLEQKCAQDAQCM
ncbi:multiheme c-type cytochrome [Agaribacter flavus]|uniref:Multiheme c-type cytochrome n=1 Tax=Agaribacter flavus TaxID=1902781 RepID=A0ABV7FNC3_9ALTE